MAKRWNVDAEAGGLREEGRLQAFGKGGEGGMGRKVGEGRTRALGAEKNAL